MLIQRINKLIQERLHEEIRIKEKCSIATENLKITLNKFLNDETGNN